MSDDVTGLPAEVPPAEPTQTGSGAATNKAHQDAGDGATTGSVPAGLTVDELLEQADQKRDDGGTG